MSSDTEPHLVLVLLLTDIVVMSTICVAAGRPVRSHTGLRQALTANRGRSLQPGKEGYNDTERDVGGSVQSTLCHVLCAAHRCRWLTDLRRVAAQSFLSASSQQGKDAWLGTFC